MNAKEAKEMTDKCNEVEMNIQLKRIMESIEKAVRKGHYRVKLRIDLLRTTKAKLIEDGYNVDADNWYVYVDWGN
jgi:molybdenum cofactor biosynthesis enzyme MoaA